MAQTRIIVFLRAPQPGFVKTRLAAAIGAEAACAAYRQMVEQVLPVVRAVRLPTELRFTPDDAREEIKAWAAPGWETQPQGAGDLGARLTRAFEAAFASGASRAIVIGTDCPSLAASDLRAADRALRRCDLVVGPAADGGYWLIGLCRPAPGLFDAVPWSTDQVLGVTLHKARQLRLSVELLRILEDIDTAEDWDRVRPR